MMNRLMKCCLCTVLLLLLIPFAVFADSSSLEDLAMQISSAGSIDSQLALINEAAESYSGELESGSWDISLNAAPAGELPEGLLPDSYEDAQTADQLPEELKEGTILALYDDEGDIRLLGDFMARFSPERRASTLDSADIMLVLRHEDVARTDYIGSAYNRDYYAYMWRIGSGDIYRIFYQCNTPPFSGMGTLYGSSMSTHDLWEATRFQFFSDKVISGESGVTTTYTLMNGGWCLSNLEGDRMVLEVPGEIDGYPVTGISCTMYGRCPSLQRVVMSEGVKYIEEGVFRDLEDLTEVVLPESLVSIGASAFNGCNSLKELVIPDNVESIGDNAFSNMLSLEALQLPAAPVTLGTGVVTGFNRMGSFALPEGLTELTGGCFQDSYGLSALYIPASVVNFPETIPSWITVYTPNGSPAQMWAEKQELSTVACDSADDMPQLVVEQEDQFYYVVYEDEAILVNTDSGIQYVNLPDTLGGAPLTAIRHAFRYDDTVVYISIPEGITTIGNDFCYSCSALEQVQLPSTLVQIGDNAFADCSSLTSLTLPEGLQSIGRSLAERCGRLSSVTLPSTLTEISEDCLYSNTSLASLIVPEGIRKLPEGMLYDCPNLLSIYLPKSVVQIDASLPSQVTIFAPEGSPALMWAESNNYLFKAMEDPYQMPMAEMVDEGDFVYYLYDGEALLKLYNGTAENLVIPETLGGMPVTTILSNAISSDNLISVTVADSVRRLNYYAFYDNDYLEELYLPGTIEYMDEGAIRSIYHDCAVYAPEGSYAWDFVSQDLNCAGGHVFTLENWDHESVPAEAASENSGFFPDLDSLMPEPLLTYGSYAQVEPDESETLEDGSIRQRYSNVSRDNYSAYGTALGNAGYSILQSDTEGGIVNLTLALGDIQFTMIYDPASEIMEFTFPADANLG